MTYVTLADMSDRFGDDELQQLTDRELPQQGSIVQAVLDKAIADADSLIDAHLGARYAVPIASPLPPELVRVGCDLARFFLHDQAVPEIVRERYEDAVRWLRSVADGKLPLVGSDGALRSARSAVYSGSSRVQTYPDDAVFGSAFAAAWQP